jgi:hypothetical protein
MQDVQVNLNPGLPMKMQHSKGKALFARKLDSDFRKKLQNITFGT